MGRLKLSMPGALTQVAGDNQCGEVEGGKKLLERFHLFEIGVSAEVQIGEMSDGDDGHQITRMR